MHLCVSVCRVPNAAQAALTCLVAVEYPQAQSPLLSLSEFSCKWLQYGLRQAQRHVSTSSSAMITPAIEAQLKRMQYRHAELCKQLTGVRRTALRA